MTQASVGSLHPAGSGKGREVHEGSSRKKAASCILRVGGGDQAMLGKETREAAGLTGL